MAFRKDKAVDISGDVARLEIYRCCQARWHVDERHQKPINEQQADRYDKEKDELQPEAKKLEQEVQAEQRRGDRFDSGEALLEIALVIASITLLTKRRLFRQQGSILGALGVLNAISAWIYVNSDHGGRASPPVQLRSDDASPLRFS